MFSPRSIRFFGDDLFNRNHLRNADNTNQIDYNCGGYALGIFSWYCPHDDEVWGYCESWDKEYVAQLTAECVEYMLRDFTDLRIIKHLREVHCDEYAIAFRISSDGDFHYAKQENERTWTHKTGMGCIYEMTCWEVLHSKWCRRYDGPIILFAKKRD